MRHSETAMRSLRPLAVFLILCSLVADLTADRWVFTSPSQSKELLRFRFNDQSGQLTERTAIPMAGNPFVMTTDQTGDILYVSFRGPESIGAFRINRKTGGLTPVGTRTIDETPAYLFVDKERRVLFSAYYRAGLTMVHRLDRNGAVSSAEPQIIKTAERAHSVMIDKSNRFVYVPHTRPESIFGFRYDPTGRNLQPLNPPITKTPLGFGPRHLQFHPNGRHLFVDNEQGDSLTCYSIDRNTGTLRSRQTVSTIPADWTQNNSTSDFQITSDGRFAYVCNRGHNSLAMIAIDPKTGQMKSLGQQPIGEVVRSISIPPGDRFVIVGGTVTGQLAVHAINPQNGKLTFRGKYEAGPRIWWVLNV